MQNHRYLEKDMGKTGSKALQTVNICTSQSYLDWAQ